MNIFFDIFFYTRKPTLDHKTKKKMHALKDYYAFLL